jgi:serine/threonine protein kinase
MRGTLQGDAHTAAQSHLDVCEVCQDLLAGLLATASPIVGLRTPEPNGIPRTIGKYHVREVVGTGAMGVVYLADDPQLNRAVAVKVLRRPQAEGAERLRREARALARIAHPNVIVVHEVGTVEDHVFMAMEFVDGASLTTWLSDRERNTSEILAVFAQAGRGLAVAHAAGLVHRDFKPDNVLVGRDGRVRVVDFGLARADLVGEPVATDEDPNSKTPLLGLTRTGAFIGTPAYMAPEQFTGGPTDARTDQFGFAVALFEALHGRRPFEATTLAELTATVTRGEVTVPRGPRQVPKHVMRALLRALLVDPDARFASMDDFIAELTRRERRSVWPFYAVAAALVITVGGVASSRRPPNVETPAPAPLASTVVVPASTVLPSVPPSESATPVSAPHARAIAPSKRHDPRGVSSVVPAPPAAAPASSSDLFDSPR